MRASSVCSRERPESRALLFADVPELASPPSSVPELYFGNGGQDNSIMIEPFNDQSLAPVSPLSDDDSDGHPREHCDHSRCTMPENIDTLSKPPSSCALAGKLPNRGDKLWCEASPRPACSSDTALSSSPTVSAPLRFPSFNSDASSSSSVVATASPPASSASASSAPFKFPLQFPTPAAQQQQQPPEQQQQQQQPQPQPQQQRSTPPPQSAKPRTPPKAISTSGSALAAPEDDVEFDKYQSLLTDKRRLAARARPRVKGR